MEIKKSKTADLETRRPTLLLLGFILAFGLTLESFEWLKSDVGLKPLSSLESEDLYEPIQEVMIAKPTPKMNRNFSQPKRSYKGPVIVKDELIKEVKEPTLKPKTKLQPNQNETFNLGNDLPKEENDLINSIPKVDTFGFATVELKPEFVGGESEMIKFISKNINYPKISKNKGAQGVVFVSFIIDEKGYVTNVSIAKGLEKHLDKESLRVIEKMPKWNPGKQRGIPVKVKYTIPVNYILKD